MIDIDKRQLWNLDGLIRDSIKAFVAAIQKSTFKLLMTEGFVENSALVTREDVSEHDHKWCSAKLQARGLDTIFELLQFNSRHSTEFQICAWKEY